MVEVTQLAAPPEVPEPKLGRWLFQAWQAIRNLQRTSLYVRDVVIQTPGQWDIDYRAEVNDLNNGYLIITDDSGGQGGFAVAPFPGPVGAILESVQIVGLNGLAGTVQALTCSLTTGTSLRGDFDDGLVHDEKSSPSTAEAEWDITLRPPNELKVRADRRTFVKLQGANVAGDVVLVFEAIWTFLRPVEFVK